MFNFQQLVSSIIFEEEATSNNTLPSQPQPWLNEILKKHNDLFGNTVNLTDAATGNTIFSALKASYASEQTALSNIGIIRLLDFFQQLYDMLPAPKPDTWTKFINKINVSTGQIAEFGQQYLNGIKQLTQDKKIQWDVASGKIRKAWQQAQSAGDKQAAVALNTYNNKSVIDTVQSIVNKRIDVFKRLGRLKGPFRPFGVLIEDIFKTPELYTSGQKKYTNDFDAVDDLYIKDLITVALAAKEFYATEITNLKLQQLETSSLQKFNKRFKDILNELSSAEISAGKRRVYIPPTQQTQSQQTNKEQQKQVNKDVQEKVYQKALKDEINRINFLWGQPISYNTIDLQTGEKTGERTTNPDQYTIGNIQKMETTEAANLIKALQSIALYIRKSVGAGERLKYASQAVGALASFGGASLYGGPS